MNKLIIILIFLLLAVFHETFIPSFNLFGFSFNLFLLFFFLLIFSGQMKWWIAVIAGLILDILSLFPFGIFTFALFLTYLLINSLSKIFQSTNIVSFIILFLAFFISYKIFLIFGKLVFNLFL